MYEGDTPNAERRAAALSLDRDLLRELLGQEELRELIDPGALEEVEADLQRVSERTRAANADGLHDVLRALGDLTADEAQARCLPVVAAARILDRAREGAPRRAHADRRRGALDRRRGRGPLPRRARRRAARRPARHVPRGGRGAARAARAPLRAHARPVHHARGVGALRRSTSGRSCASWSAPATSSAASCAPAAREREWCDTEVLRRLRRASLATLRQEVEPAEQRALARFLPEWQGVDRAPPGGAGVDRLREMLVPLQGLALAPEVWERDVLPRRVGAYSPAWMDQLCASGELVWVGAGALGRNSGRVALSCSARTRAGSGPPPFKGEPPSEPAHDAIRERLARRRRVLDRPAGRPRRGRARRAPGGALGPRLGGRGHERRLRPAARAEAVRGEDRPPGAAAASRDGAGPARRRCRAAGRSPAPLFAGAPAHGPRMRAISELLLERHGIVTREAVLAEGIPGGFAGAVLGAVEPGDARHRPPRLLRRGPGRRAVRPPGRDRAAARAALRRARRHARARRHRPGQPVRRHAALAEARRRRVEPPPGARAGRVRGDARLRARPVRRARRQGPARAARARRGVAAARARGARRTRCAAAACRGSASSASTASRWWAPRPARS